MPRMTKPKPKLKLRKTRTPERVKEEGLWGESAYGKEFPLFNDPVFNKLNHRQKRFVYYIFLQPVTNWSKGKCYQEAYDNSNMNACYTGAVNNLRKPMIKHCVDQLKELFKKSLQFEAGDTLSRMKCVVNADIRKLFHEDGRLILNPYEWPDGIHKYVKGFNPIKFDPETGKPYSMKIELKDALAAEKIGIEVAGTKSSQKHELSGPGGKPIQHDIRKIEIVLIRSEDRDEMDQII